MTEMLKNKMFLKITLKYVIQSHSKNASTKKYFIRIHDEIFVIRWIQLTYVLVISIGDPPVVFVAVLAAIGGPLGLTIVGGIAGLMNLSDVRLLDEVTTWPCFKIIKYFRLIQF